MDNTRSPSRSSSSSATIYDLTEDWSYYENNYVLTQPAPAERSISPSLVSQLSSLLGWHTSDYMSSSSSEETSQYSAEVASLGNDDSPDSEEYTDDEPTVMDLLSPLLAQQSILTRHNSAGLLIPAQSPTRLTPLMALTRQTEAQTEKWLTLEHSFAEQQQLVDNFKILITLQQNLLTPIHSDIPAPVERAKLSEENLPPYNPATITAKLAELSRLRIIIDEGFQRYNALRILLSTEQWTVGQALPWFKVMKDRIACNEERREADQLISTIPFQAPTLPMGGTKRRTRRLHFKSAPVEISDAHRAANEAAKAWRGHVEIRDDHLETHIRVFGALALPELPKQVLLPVNDFGELISNTSSGRATPAGFSTRSSLADDADSERTWDADSSAGAELSPTDSVSPLLQQQPHMVKSQSRKAMQLLGIKDEPEEVNPRLSDTYPRILW